MNLHWMTRYDPDDGEPVGQTCDCEIGDDHDLADLDDEDLKILAAPDTDKIAFRAGIQLGDDAHAVVTADATVGIAVLGPDLARTWCARMGAAEARRLAAALVEAAGQIDPRPRADEDEPEGVPSVGMTLDDAYACFADASRPVPPERGATPMTPETEHPFVAYAAHHATLGSLREVITNWLANEQEGLPRDNAQCAAVVMMAMEAYMQAQPVEDDPPGRLTLDEARKHVGHRVAYHPEHGPVEEGVITSVGHVYAFVRYGMDTTSQATDPAFLRPIGGDR